jgi:2-polyprenyl-6-methoxyphenol hydroxylase-like FAD-dependent oxidoreductase
MVNETVLVLGGGPAGCAAASLLARWGHQVVLRTRAASAGAPLVESIPPSTRKLFDTIGLRAAIDGAGFVRSSGHTVWWGSGAARVERFADGELGWQVLRSDFEAQLLAHCSSAGVAIEHARVSPTIVNSAEHAFLIDGTGRSGVVARARGLRVPDPGRIVALTAMWQSTKPFAVPEPSHTLIESYEGGWAWSAPESPHRRVVAMMVDPATSGLARDVSAREIYLHELKKSVHLATMVEGATLVDGPSGWDASMYHATRYVDNNVLLVGDAASFVDPVSSVWLAAVAVNTCLRRPAMRDAALGFFAARETEVYAALKTATLGALADAASSHAHPFWADRAAVDASEHSPDGPVPIDASAEFDRVRREPALRMQRAPDLRLEDRAAVNGDEIVLEPRLVSDRHHRGTRYAFGVDLFAVVELAPSQSSVPDLLTAYNQRCPPVALPDLLAALSTALAMKWLVWTS